MFDSSDFGDNSSLSDSESNGSKPLLLRDSSKFVFLALLSKEIGMCGFFFGLSDWLRHNRVFLTISIAGRLTNCVLFRFLFLNDDRIFSDMLRWRMLLPQSVKVILLPMGSVFELSPSIVFDGARRILSFKIQLKFCYEILKNLQNFYLYGVDTVFIIKNKNLSKKNREFFLKKARLVSLKPNIAFLENIANLKPSDLKYNS
ncbi:hypothetical protein BpHYR1_019266 [Brachionus plicatilis]|uniref:Uncharacterized protein n=1 Tax=Brachionus plicatilis TaxID=10195 RepID=A0A3M7PEH6_BRAPC|nr:hypothetical protein BpHYR1_019266 [Brachionus plicatilis]